jgi:hypothetical protein
VKRQWARAALSGDGRDPGPASVRGDLLSIDTPHSPHAHRLVNLFILPPGVKFRHLLNVKIVDARGLVVIPGGTMPEEDHVRAVTREEAHELCVALAEILFPEGGEGLAVLAAERLLATPARKEE